jgi:hypothetical protein
MSTNLYELISLSHVKHSIFEVCLLYISIVGIMILQSRKFCCETMNPSKW